MAPQMGNSMGHATSGEHRREVGNPACAVATSVQLWASRALSLKPMGQAQATGTLRPSAVSTGGNPRKGFQPSATRSRW
eukprot:7218980-Lingulodinium_polyedra.AAC.1